MGDGSAEQAISPLAERFLLNETPVAGKLKVRPEDFLVDEIALYEPSGAGEHLYLGIQKTNVAHLELVSVVARHFDVPRSAVGFAGMKDKHAVTRQAISVHLPGRDVDPGIDHDRIAVLWSMRHINKLRRGHLRGNRFSIRIRDIDPIKTPLLQKRLDRLVATGVPNAFGEQRFGYRRNNHLIGRAILAGEWQAGLDEMLGGQGEAYPSYQAERRDLYDRGRYEDAFKLWSAADRSERATLRALMQGRKPRAAFRAIGQPAGSFFLAAFQSAIFNRVLDERLAAGTLAAIVPGDLAWRHNQGSVFAVADGEDMTALAERAAALDISPSGPLWGSKMTRAAAAVDGAEIAALNAFGAGIDDLTSPAWPDGRRRPLRTVVTDAGLEGGVDEHGAYVRVAFDLPRSSYATVFIRELLQYGGPTDADDDVDD